MDQSILHETSQMFYERPKQAHYAFHPNRFEDFTTSFTRNHNKAIFDTTRTVPFIDAGSRHLRNYFPRHDYVLQNTDHGCMLRSVQPRLRKNIVMPVE